MGGGGESSRTNTFLPGQNRVREIQSEIGIDIGPGLKEWLYGVFSGTPASTTGYGQSLRQPIESATQRALQGIMARTPEGTLRQQLLEQAREAGGLKLADTEQGYLKDALKLAAAIFGGDPVEQGETKRVSGPGLAELLGPLTSAGAVVGSSIIGGSARNRPALEVGSGAMGDVG